MSIEVIEHEGTTYAEVIWADLTGGEDALLLASRVVLPVRPAGSRSRVSRAGALPQVLSSAGSTTSSRCSSSSAASSTSSSTRTRADCFRVVRLETGDAIVLIRGVHAIHVVEDFQALSVKQGPFFGDEVDKVEVVVETAA